MSNTGSMGNMGNMGNMGGGGSLSRGAFFPDRGGLPFVTASGKKDSDIAANNANLPSFLIGNWSTEHYAWLVLTDFVKLRGQKADGKDWGWDTWGDDILSASVPGYMDSDRKPMWTPHQTGATVMGELSGLVTAARNERADALGEILGQSDEFVSFFLQLLSASNGYPATARLLSIANFVGSFCAMFYKGKFARPRPSMLCPALMPPIPVPGHASFPSGHATQAQLMALCMKAVIEHLPDDRKIAINNNLEVLALRIARNREIAGLHYPSDSCAGRTLAGKIRDLLITTLGDTNQWFQEALAAARAEWGKKRET